MLPRTLIHNGAHQPIALYRGHMATASQWTALIGADLPAASTGDDPTIVSSPVYGKAPDMPGVVHANKVYQESTSGTGQVTTEDFVIELVAQYDTWATTATVQILAATRYGGSEHNWDVRRGAENTISLLIEDASGVGLATSSAVLADNTRSHILIFVDRDGSAYFWIDSASAGSGSVSAHQGDLSNSRLFTIGGTALPNYKTGSVIDHFAMWSGSGLVDPTGSAMADTAAQRFATLPALN